MRSSSATSDSSNGTYVDGTRTPSTRLWNGAKIELGHAVLKFVQLAPEVTDADRLVLMGRSDLLRALDLPVLAAAAKLMAPRSVPKGGVVLRQGTPMEGMIFVHRGALRVVDVNEEGGERVVGRVEAGGHFGERALVTAVSAPQTLVASEDSCVLELTMAALDRVMEKQPDDSGAVARTVLKKLQTEQRKLPAVRARHDDLADILAPTAVAIIGEDKRLIRAKERLEGLSKETQPILIVGPQGSASTCSRATTTTPGRTAISRTSRSRWPTRGPGTTERPSSAWRPGRTARQKGRTGLLEMIGEGTLAIAHAELLDPHLQALLADYLRLGWFHRSGGRKACAARPGSCSSPRATKRRRGQARARTARSWWRNASSCRRP